MRKLIQTEKYLSLFSRLRSVFRKYAGRNINSEKLYRFIEEELDDHEREIIAKRYGIPDKDGRVCKPLAQQEIWVKLF